MPVTVMARRICTASTTPVHTAPSCSSRRRKFQPFLLPSLEEEVSVPFDISPKSTPSTLPSSPSASPANESEEDFFSEEEEDEDEGEQEVYEDIQLVQSILKHSSRSQWTANQSSGQKNQKQQNTKKNKSFLGEEATTYTVRSFRNNPFAQPRPKTPLPVRSSSSYPPDYDIALRLLKSDLEGWRKDSRQYLTIKGNETTKAIIISVIELLLGTYQQHFTFSPSTTPSSSSLTSSSSFFLPSNKKLTLVFDENLDELFCIPDRGEIHFGLKLLKNSMDDDCSSRYLLEKPYMKKWCKNKEDALLWMILHEFVHLFPGCRSHGKTFFDKVEEVAETHSFLFSPSPSPSVAPKPERDC